MHVLSQRGQAAIKGCRRTKDDGRWTVEGTGYVTLDGTTQPPSTALGDVTFSPLSNAGDVPTGTFAASRMTDDTFTRNAICQIT